MLRKFTPTLVGVLVLLLTGCGGGSSPEPEPELPSPTTPIEPDKNAALSAIANEDHTLATAKELIDYSLGLTAKIDRDKSILIDELYQDIQSLTWFPSHDSAFYQSYLPENTFTALSSTHHSNGDISNKGLVMVGDISSHRYAAMGANLMAVDVSSQTVLFTKSLFSWLTNNDEAKLKINLVTSHVPSKSDSRYFQHNEKIRDWLSENYPDNNQINDAHSCDAELLLSCLKNQKPDILILSDADKEQAGFNAIASAIEYAKSENIPILVSNYRRGESEFLAPIYQYMGISANNNYWSKHQAQNLTTEDLLVSEFARLNDLLENLDKGVFDSSSLENCTKNFINCTSAEFELAFKSGADWYRLAATSLDNDGINPFDNELLGLLNAGLLLADKYRSMIDYPIEFTNEKAWQQAMFADWAISYKRENNLAQPDLGEYVTDKNNLAVNSNAHYRYEQTTAERQQISVPYSNQWTTTGWYVQPGHTITLTRHDDSTAQVMVKLNYHRSNTNRAFSQHVYRSPLALSEQRLYLSAGETLTFSSPYGGPLYLYISGDELPLSVDVSANNVAKHPTITDFNDSEQVSNFEKALSGTELPHVDLKTFGAEQHMRKDKFTGAIGEIYPNVNALLKGVQEDHINTVYTLAGYKIEGQSLSESLPFDVQGVCGNLSSEEDCLDESLHTRSKIQHANYDQNAHCGSGCSGNPWDSSGNISPSGWLDNHELGHNLQTKRLNVAYAESEHRNDWSKYSSRAGENSNNIFPYYVKWRSHYVSQNKNEALTDGHTNHKDFFNVFMSDTLGLSNDSGDRLVFDRKCNILPDGESRYVAPWKSNDYAVHNSYRMSFYIQLAFHFDKLNLLGQRLENGFNIYTLMYQHERVFGKYSQDESMWLVAKDRLGFSEFPYSGHDTYAGNTISTIPGNDFMLITLSKLASQDWRGYFDMYGLYYSDLAAAQVIKENYSSAFNKGMYMVESELPDLSISESLPFLPLSESDKSTIWRDGSSPEDCQ